MEREPFVSEAWWLTEGDIGYQLTPLRTSLGEAFGWTDSSWYTQRARLEELHDFIQAQQSGLLSELDNAQYEDKRQSWLEQVIALKSPPTQAPTGGSAPTALPSIAHLTAMEQTLLEGALEKTTIDDAVRQIYDNMHHKTGWKYNASVTSINGDDYIKGSKNTGMCESYRNAFAAALKVYDGLRAQHPVDAIRNGQLTIEADDALAPDRFCTREGLTLMGNGLKGNVYLEVDGKGAILARGADSINKFVFKGHWTSKVNGVVYDPIFYSIGENNVGLKLDGKYEAGGGKFLPITTLPVPTGEFGATFIWISDWDEFKTTVAAMKDLYKQNIKEIDGILEGKTPSQTRKVDKDSVKQAKDLVAKGVANVSIFLKVVQDGKSQTFSESDFTAVSKVLDLATKF